MLYSSYFGGNNADRAINLHITEDGGAILIGETKSITFPIFGVDDENIKINNGVIYDSGDPPSDIFVAKFLNNGKLNWSILFGSSGVDNIYSADYNDNRLVIVGNTNNIMDFPKDNAFKGGYMLDGFMIKLSFEALGNNNLSDDIGEIEDSMNSNMENQVNQNMKELNDNENSFDIISYGVIGLTLGIPIINIFRKNNIMDRILKRNSLSSTNNELSDYLNKIRNE